MATYDDWVPIPPMAELKVRVKLLDQEHVTINKHKLWIYEAIYSNCDTADAAIAQGCDEEQVEEMKLRANKELRQHEENHDTELHHIEALTKAAREDMWDHDYMCNHGYPCSAKRKRHFRAMCDPFPRLYAKQWAYDHLPSDVRAERRARALERWRKGAYLLGILTFWTRITCEPGGRGSRAAIERASKRARGE